MEWFSFSVQDVKDLAGSPIREAQGVLKYTLRLEDVDHIISFRCLPVRSDGVHGESKAVISSAPIEAGTRHTHQDSLPQFIPLLTHSWNFQVHPASSACAS